jgi:hypothetical protein
MMRTTFLFLATCFSVSVSFAQGVKMMSEPTLPEKAQDKVLGEAAGSIKKARVFFIQPKDGETVPRKFKVKMGVEGMKVRPAGEAIDDFTSGHHHLTINAGPIAAGQPVPTDSKHMHFGKGETEVEVTLPPGEHRLTLQFADGAHRSFGPSLSQTIKVQVK